ncbi:NEDD4-binding protein 1 isoform X2 [Lutzomyia longipalpis]|uniref:NEDD4-binding protein 1 isoform X2 n=1 Tax=Lutzomyia longipalpis TaxID=7200 RepID=UPI0024847090|nr:NEDD4-binding protein 1 isoform X2 [Lutzomyia longipalpis]
MGKKRKQWQKDIQSKKPPGQKEVRLRKRELNGKKFTSPRKLLKSSHNSERFRGKKKENVRRKEQNLQERQQETKLQRMTLTGDYIPLGGSPIVIPNTPSPAAGSSRDTQVRVLGGKRSREIKSEQENDDEVNERHRAKVQRYGKEIPHTVVSADAPIRVSESPKKSANDEEVGECDSTTQNDGEKEIFMDILKKEEVDPLDCSDVIEVASYQNITPRRVANVPNDPIEVIPLLDETTESEANRVIEIPDGQDDSVIFVKEHKGPGPPRTIKLTPIPKQHIKQLKLLKKKKSLEAQKKSPAATPSTSAETPVQAAEVTLENPCPIISIEDTPKSSKTHEKTPKKTPGKIRVAKQSPCVKSGEKKPRFIVLDGSNIAFHHSIMKKVFSVEGLKIAIDYFENKGHECVAVVPMFRSKARYSTNPNLLKDLNLRGKVIFSPSKNINGFSLSSYDDLLIMQVAEANDGVIVSNDNFADLLGQNIAWDTIIGTRVVGFTWFKDQFFIPLDPYGRDGPKINDILYC